MALLIQYTLIFASVLMLVALGGCFSEHSGVINIGLEGIMVIGALGGALMLKFLPVTIGAGGMVLATVVASSLFGMLFSLLLAVAAINFNADQTIIGTAMNMLGTALATVIVKALNMMVDVNNVSSTVEYVNEKKAFYFNVGNMELSWFMIIAIALLVISHIVLYKTRFGLRLRACGENPQAVDAAGGNVLEKRMWGRRFTPFKKVKGDSIRRARWVQ